MALVNAATKAARHEDPTPYPYTEQKQNSNKNKSKKIRTKNTRKKHASRTHAPLKRRSASSNPQKRVMSAECRRGRLAPEGTAVTDRPPPAANVTSTSRGASTSSSLSTSPRLPRQHGLHRPRPRHLCKAGTVSPEPASRPHTQLDDAVFFPYILDWVNVRKHT